MTDVKKDFPDRYYVSYDTTAPQPTIITGWYDTWSMSDVSNVPKIEDMVIVTESQWNDPTFHAPTGKGVENGKVIDYVPPVPLATQAKNAMVWVQQQASMASAMGEEFTDTMKAYVKALQAIIKGTDTTSTELPKQPTDIME